uniref:Centrosomin N-terminal motif 1 domain-containing protein n=1 Tax=Mucochytrium quahogii TaxID=96639 RepID=A0A7S2S9Y9_9STRA|mmetsp:Transcript_291/g.634  ORF Transcript_291/g.634 Transcript_291/m.634 type:complete len:1032 (+) Transcript_291:232-3327(+)
MDGGRPVANSPKQGELEKLSKDNFNLKLRIFYLEERLSKHRNGGGTDESLEQEIMEQKVLLDEKQQELDDRNLLLVKARNAIEGLHTDLALCKAQLAECKNNDIASEELYERERQVESLQYRVREAEEKERRHLEDIVALNSTLREVKEHAHAQRVEFQSTQNQKQALEDKLASLLLEARGANAQKAEVEKQMEQLTASFETVLHDKEDVTSELENTRSKLVEQSKIVGDLRSTEAELSGKMQDSTRHYEEKLENLTQTLEQCEQERDQNIRACALAERKVEDLESMLGDTRQLANTLQEKVRHLELESAHGRDMLHSKETSLREQNQAVLDEVRKEFSAKESSLKGQVAELRGKASALEFARDEAHQQISEGQGRIKFLEEELQASQIKLNNALNDQATIKGQVESARRESGAGIDKVKVELEQKLHDETKQYQQRLEESEGLRKKAEADLEQALARAMQREKEIKRQVRTWNCQIMGKLDDLLPHRSHPYSYDEGSSDEDQENYYRDELMSDYSGGRPKPRLFSGGNSLNISKASTSSATKRDALLNRQKSSVRNLLVRLEDLRELKNLFARSSLDMERKWQTKVKQLASMLERTEYKLQAAENKLALFIQSMQTLTRQNSVQLQGNQNTMQRQHSELIRQVRAEKDDIENRLVVSENRTQSVLADKDRIHGELVVAKEKAASLEGEMRQAKAELESVREEKNRVDHKLERLHGAHGVLEENNRVLSLELEDRGKRLREHMEQQTTLKTQLGSLKQQMVDKQQQIAKLEKKVEQATTQLRAREKQLRDSKQKLERTVNSATQRAALVPSTLYNRRGDRYPRDDEFGKDEFEQNMWRQVEETERAIRSSSTKAVKKWRYDDDSILSTGGLQLSSLEESEERFAEILVAVAELVERSREIITAAPDVKRRTPQVESLLASNASLTRDLQRLGDDFYALRRRIINAITESTNRQVAVSTTPIRSRASRSALNHRDQNWRTPDRRGANQDPSQLSSVHKDMLDRLGKIRSDLQDTATQLSRNRLDEEDDQNRF